MLRPRRRVWGGKEKETQVSVLSSGQLETGFDLVTPRSTTPTRKSSAPSPTPSGETETMESKGMFVGDWMSLPMLHLLSKSDTIFTSLQRIDQTSPDQGGAPGVEAEQRYHRVLALYLSALDEYLRSLPLEERSTPAHISEILALVHLLYFPADGMGTAIVAEELLRWINLYKPRPTSEASNAVADITNAENDWTFWDYVFICVLRGLDQTALLALEKLNNHPSHSFRKFLAQTSKLVLSMPRSTQFALEPEFAAQRHAWTLKVQSQFHLLDHTMKQMQDEAQVDSDERNFIQVNLGNLFLVLLGDQEKIMEMSDDWRDALGAWGLYVDPSLKRTDLTSALTAILQHFNLDPTDTVENALVAFARSEPLQGAKYCCQIDPWLAAHLTDLLGRAGVLSQDDTAARELLLTTIHTYADVVLEDQGLWRIAVAYLSSAGDQWRKRMRQILLSVPYEITPSGEEPGADRFKRVEELLRACSEFQMPEESRSICQGVADTLMEQGELGLAVSYSVRAGNATLIRKVVERALVVYYTQGAAQFIALVDQFPQNWLVPAGGGDSMAQFSHSLTFLGAYRDFVRMVSESDEAGAAWSLIQALAARPPQTFWAVLLIDAIPLLEAEDLLFTREDLSRLLAYFEQVVSEADATPLGAQHYLGLLTMGYSSNDRPTDVRLSDARQRLEVVRYALVRAMSKSFLAENALLSDLQ